MSDSVTKFEEDNSTMSYSGMGPSKLYTQTTTQDMTKNIDVKPSVKEKN